MNRANYRKMKCKNRNQFDFGPISIQLFKSLYFKITTPLYTSIVCLISPFRSQTTIYLLLFFIEHLDQFKFDNTTIFYLIIIEIYFILP